MTQRQGHWIWRPVHRSSLVASLRLPRAYMVGYTVSKPHSGWQVRAGRVAVATKRAPVRSTHSRRSRMHPLRMRTQLLGEYPHPLPPCDD